MFFKQKDMIIFEEADEVCGFVPARVYSLQYNKNMEQYFLRILKNNFLMKDIFDSESLKNKTDRIVNAYENQSNNLGVLFSGYKGSGKTYQMQYIANYFLANKNLPVILISNPFHGPEFDYFLNKVGECVLVFDEFTSVYNESHQKLILSFIDGSSSTKRLSMFSINHYEDLITEFKNRTGRIRYHFRYSSLSQEMISSYCEAKLTCKKFFTDILSFFKKYPFCTFDILRIVIEECNLFHEDDFDTIINNLNINLFDSMNNSKMFVKPVLFDKQRNKIDLPNESSIRMYNDMTFYLENEHIFFDLTNNFTRIINNNITEYFNGKYYLTLEKSTSRLF